MGGACLGVPCLTAHLALFSDGPLEGATVLVQGGAGAVGHYAIQIAKLLGAAPVIATASSPEKEDHARSAGADAVVNYRSEAVAERVHEITGGRGVDRVVEVDIAGNAGILPKVVARDGLCVAYGSNAPQAAFDFGPMIVSGAAVRFFIVYELAPAARAEAIRDLTRWLEEGRLHHAIAATLPLERTAEAHEIVEQGAAIGNLIVTP